MKKILILLTMATAVLTSGCAGDSVKVQDGKGNQSSVDTYTYTDKETGCEYIIFNWYQGGGASPKLDSEGLPVGCKNIKK